MTQHDMGPSRPAAIGERWKAVPMEIEQVRQMAESHWCAGWDCQTCIWIATVLRLADGLTRIEKSVRDPYFVSGLCRWLLTGAPETGEPDAIRHSHDPVGGL